MWRPGVFTRQSPLGNRGLRSWEPPKFRELGTMQFATFHLILTVQSGQHSILAAFALGSRRASSTVTSKQLHRFLDPGAT